MSMRDFAKLYDATQTISSHLFAMDTALKEMGRSLADGDMLKDKFLSPLVEPLRNLQSGCLLMLDETKKEFVHELVSTHEHIHSLEPRKRFHFHFRHYVPQLVYSAFKKLFGKKDKDPPADDPQSPLRKNIGGKSAPDLDEEHPSAPTAIADKLAKDASASGDRLGSAVLKKSERTSFSATFRQHVIIPMSNYLGFPIQFGATVIGAVWGFIALTAFGVSGAIGLICFGVIFAVPMMYIFLFNKALPVLGLLALLSYSQATLIIFINRNRPFDSPAVRLYKTLANTCMGLTFAMIFTLVIYPNLARHSLRSILSASITLINGYYADIAVNVFSRPSRKFLEQKRKEMEKKGELNYSVEADMSSIPFSEATVARLHRTHAAIALKLASVEPLMVFASVEPRVEGKFQASSYRAVIEGLKRVLDRLGNARSSAGDAKFPVPVLHHLHNPLMAKPRAELYQTIRLVEAFTQTIQTVAEANFRKEAWVRFYSYAMAVRGISLEVDALAIPLKELFGELPNLAFEEDGTEEGSENDVMLKEGTHGAEGVEPEDPEVAKIAGMNTAFANLLAMSQKRQEEVVFDRKKDS
ncbi:hypothetical protein HDU96_000709 [Phlyctochytrium bullatum]|nr:hypothetical protein HDU96_000709 [Phlyctochytrium bullatum]